MPSYVKDRDDMPEFQAGKDAATQATAQAKELSARFARIISTFDPAQRLTAQQINIEAARENIRRLRTLAASSSAQPQPNPYLHVQMDALLDQRYDNIVTQDMLTATHRLTTDNHVQERQNP